MFETIEKTLMSKILWIVAIIVIVYLYLKIVVYSYWKRHGIPHEEPTIPFGTLGRKFLTKKIGFGEEMRRSYEKFKKHPFHGLYTLHKPTLMINDPEVIKYVLVKEFTSFADRGTYVNDAIDPLNGNLFLTGGEKWKKLRIKFTPTFTSGKLKHMYPFVQEIADELINIINENLVKTDVIEFKELIARYTTDSIFSLAFGVDSQTQRNHTSQFRRYGDLATRSSPVKNCLLFFAPSVMNLFSIPYYYTDVSKFFTTLFKDMVEKRKMDGTNRKDFLNLLMELMDNDQIEEKKSNVNKTVKVDMLVATAQAFVFFLAGFETSSTMVTYTLYELALNPEEQEKVHKEIDKLFENGESFSYENIFHLKYLEMVFFETLRKHPSLPFLNRVCIKDCKLPNSDFVIPKGMPLIISISALHRDPDHYPDPDKFDPTRFSKENINARRPYTFLPFGEGPRNCIGKRVGTMMSMVALATLLSKFKFSICEKTAIPLHYVTEGLLQAPKNGVYLQVEKRYVKY